MFDNLVVNAWIGIRAHCSMSYCINTEEDVDFMVSDGARRFEFAIETEALRTLLAVGSKALVEMDARAERKAAVQHEVAAAQGCSA